jgi:hypothetical protein
MVASPLARLAGRVSLLTSPSLHSPPRMRGIKGSMCAHSMDGAIDRTAWLVNIMAARGPSEALAPARPTKVHRWLQGWSQDVVDHVQRRLVAVP